MIRTGPLASKAKNGPIPYTPVCQLRRARRHRVDIASRRCNLYLNPYLFAIATASVRLPAPSFVNIELT